jgi:Zn-dependent M16 (insulinase) family peptidase
LNAHFNESDWVSEEMGGISNLFFVRRLVSEVEEEWDSVLEKLEKIRAILINRRGMICNVTVDMENWKDFQPKLKTFINKIPERPFEHVNWTRDAVRANEGFTLPAQVNYVGKGGNLFDYGYKSHGSTQVIKKFLGTTWLWEKVRVQGGAYGGFALFNRISGVFGFLSYRDPNLLNTLENYDRTSDFLRSLELSQDELTKSIIGTIGDMDPYQLPDAKGYTSLLRYLTEVTDENRQQLRDEVLATTQADFKAFAGFLEQINKNGHVVVMGSEEAVQMANEQQGGGWLEIEKVL